MREGRPSRTALQVALAVPLIARRRRLGVLLPPDLVTATEDILRSAGSFSRGLVERAQSRWYRGLARTTERLTVPGLTLHLALRKRWVGDEVESALESGVRQVLVVGAGLDSLCHRLAPRHPETRFVEIDHPASQAVKQKALARLAETGRLASPNHRLVSADFSRTDLLTVVRGIDGWRTDEPAVVIAEGLLMYLSDDDVASFFDRAVKVAGKGSRILFSYLQRAASGRFLLGPAGGLALLGLKLQGEPWKWGIRTEELPEFLGAHAWTLTEPERYDLRRRYLEPAGLGDEPLSRLERLAVAVR